jgi:4-hydroxybenzoyl-CoA reductase subunit beta
MELMPRFSLHKPETASAAVALRTAEPEARYLAGGTDMIVNVRRGIERPTALIDLNAIPGMQGIEADGGGLRIGAGVTLAEIAADRRVAAGWPAVAQAAGAVAGPTHRNYGTLGGNLCLDTRCIFYNQSEWWRQANDYCLKHLGTVCHVAPGGKRCFAAFSGDVAPALLVYDAEIEIAGTDGPRRRPLAALYRADGMDHLTLAPGELVLAVHLPPTTAGVRSAYAKIRIRGSIDFPLAGAAVRLALEGGKLAELRIGLTAVAPAPFLVKGLDTLLGRPLDDAALERIKEAVRRQARPMRTTTIKPWYRRRAVAALAAKLARGLAG